MHGVEGRVLDIENGLESVRSLCWSPDGSVLVCAGDDKDIKLVDFNSNAVSRTLQGHAARVWSVGFNNDGSLMASASKDHTIRLWRIENGGAVSVPLKGHTGEVNSVALQPNGNLIASGSDDCTVKLWEVDGDNHATLKTTLDGHSAWVRCETQGWRGVQSRVFFFR